jgi:uncharacterized protein YjbI with pentapeptide repeats
MHSVYNSATPANFRGTKGGDANMSALEMNAVPVESDLTDALRLHRQWLETRGREGEPANFSSFRLRDVNLSGCDLRGAIFAKCDLTGASFERANLEGADLTQARLEGAVFHDANLRDTRLFNANLESADLSRAKFLKSAQLCGCRLSHAELPANITFHGLEQANQSLARIAVQFASMVSLCIYSWLVIGSTTDVDLITNASSVAFPFVDLSLPILAFYLLVPIALPAVSAAFYIHLSTFWDNIATLPAFFPDGSELTSRTPPTLLDRLIERHMVQLRKIHNSPGDRIYAAVITAGLFGIVPLTLFMFWLRYLPRHEPVGTALHLLMVCSFLIYASFLALSMKAKLRIIGHEQRTRRRTLRRAVFSIGIAAALTAVSLQALYGPRLPIDFFYAGLRGQLLAKGEERAWNGGTAAAVTDLAKANLRYADMTGMFAENADLSQATLERGALNRAVLRNASLRQANLNHATLRRTQMQGADLRRAQLFGATLAQADLAKANLTQADLRNSDLSGASVANANFSRANLSNLADGHGVHGESVTFALAEIQRARFSRAHLPKANFFLSDLREAHLWKARLRGASFIFADLTSANLTQADLTGADLSQATLRETILERATLAHAQLVYAQLYDAQMTGANLTRANLRGAQLRGAVLRDARLTGADLGDALLEAADLEGADLRGVDLSLASGLEAAQLKTALVDEKTTLPRELLAQRAAILAASRARAQ